VTEESEGDEEAVNGSVEIEDGLGKEELTSSILFMKWSTKWLGRSVEGGGGPGG